ncbi:MAG: neutral/alkaline non-lysosomal ceramidase N-terminal domain-containing protein [Candidatus Bathyarchaeota archaeon]|nr:MAG: neutral/alkaline non-lysosomal ceramidase N-terminal domain-containing protein [Candidatus Bathyarchaeota archaeon]
MKVGVSSRVITPPVGIPMAGFSGRIEVSQGIHDDLYAKILLIQSGDTRVALVTFDLLQLGRTEMNRLREIVGRRIGVSPCNVITACSHTHSGPAIKPNPLSSLSIKKQVRLIDSWLEELHSSVDEMASEAAKELLEAKVKHGTNLVTGISYNRRKKIAEGAYMLIMKTSDMKDAVREQYKEWGMPSELIEKLAVPGIPTGPIDPELSVLRFQTMNGDPISILVNFSCHPVTLGPHNLLISADYPGYLTHLVEEAENTAVFFTQGASGNVRPFYSERSFCEAERIGMALASATLKTMKTMAPLPSDVSVKIANWVFELPLREIPSSEEAERLIIKREEELNKSVREQDFRQVRRLSEELVRLRRAAGQPVELPRQWLGVSSKKPVEQVPEPTFEQEEVCELQALAVGNVTLAAIPGELFAELGLRIKKRARFKRVAIVTLANGSVGYVPTKEAYEEGGYETNSLLRPDVGELIVDRMAMLIDGLSG